MPQLFLEPRLMHPRKCVFALSSISDDCRSLERYMQALPESVSAPHLLPDGALRQTYPRPVLRSADISLGQVSAWTGALYSEDNVPRCARGQADSL